MTLEIITAQGCVREYVVEQGDPLGPAPVALHDLLHVGRLEQLAALGVPVLPQDHEAFLVHPDRAAGVGDVVPPGEGWTVDPYGGDLIDGKVFGRGACGRFLFIILFDDTVRNQGTGFDRD